MDPTYIRQRCDLIPDSVTYQVQRFKNQLIDIAFLYARFGNPNLILALDKLKGEMGAASEEQPPLALNVYGISSAMFIAIFWLIFVFEIFWAAGIVGVMLLILHVTKLAHDVHAKDQHILAQQSIKDLMNLCDSLSFAIRQEHPMPASSNVPKHHIPEEPLPSYTS